MPRNWLASSSALSCTLMLLCAHPAPAKATRPTVHASRILDSVSMSTMKELNDVREHGLLGLRLEDSAKRKKALAEARKYSDARKSGTARALADFISQCMKNSGENPYCEMEVSRIAEKAMANSEARTASEPVAVSHVKSVIESADIKQLATLPATTVSRVLNQYEDFQPAMKLAQKLASTKDCVVSGDMSWTFAAKAEEFFPDINLVELSRKLHSRAAECGTGMTTDRSRLRYALISIWQNKCSDAEAPLRKLTTSADTHFQARSKYWLFHCAGVDGNKELQAEMRENLWTNHRLSFHSLAANATDPRLQEMLQEPALTSKVQLRSLLRPELNRHLRATEALIEIGEPGLASDMVQYFIPKLTTAEPEVRLYTAALMNRAGYALPKFKILSSLLQDSPRLLNRETLTLLFPKWFHELVAAKTGDVDSFLIMSLIRQESAFNVKAHSLAGARGLMQVMPATARTIASVRRDRLYDPKTNIRVGTKYFLHRLGQYNNDVELTLAAYNAGFTRVDRWVKRYPLENKILFMDLVPFRETRDYISSILRNYYWYTQLYAKTPVTTSIVTANAGQNAIKPALSLKQAE